MEELSPGKFHGSAPRMFGPHLQVTAPFFQAKGAQCGRVASRQAAQLNDGRDSAFHRTASGAHVGNIASRLKRSRSNAGRSRPQLSGGPHGGHAADSRRRRFQA